MAGWFRFYDEALDDPKLQNLPPDLFKVIVNLWCLANRNGGKIPGFSAVSFAFREDQKRCEEWIDKLRELRFIDTRRGELVIHNWNKRQFKSDYSTPRVKKFRQRYGNGKGNVSETTSETHQNRAEQSRTETPKVPKGTNEYTADFEVFWSLYPKHVGKGAAFKVWRKIKPTEETKIRICAAVQAQKILPQWTREHGQYIPNPATWLNQSRWDDDAGSKDRKLVPVC